MKETLHIRGGQFVNQVGVKFWEVVYAENRIDSRGCTWKTMISNWSVSMYTRMRPAAATSSLMTSSWILSLAPWTASNLAPTDTSSPPPPPPPPGPGASLLLETIGPRDTIEGTKPPHEERDYHTSSGERQPSSPVSGSLPPLFKKKNVLKFF
jgi:hypothetical protein